MKRTLVGEAKRRLAIMLCLAMGAGTAILSETPARAQNQNSRPMQFSDLASENLSRVAASAGEIKPLLLKDSGLMVELKRWVAKDATDHGQIITDADLTNDAIFYRLENDVEFRAIATLLLQKYGYLVPEVNPDSEAGREQQLLMQERVKWITQEEEEARQQQHQQVVQAIQKGALCATGTQADCGPAMRNIPAQILQRRPEHNCNKGNRSILFHRIPHTTRSILFPDKGTNPLERAQLMETGGVAWDRFFAARDGEFVRLFAGFWDGSESAGASPNLLQQMQAGGKMGSQDRRFCRAA